MTFLRVISLLLVVLPVFPVNRPDARIPKEDPEPLTIRAGSHPDFLRIVIEGRRPVLLNAVVEQKGGELIVSFNDHGVGITAKDLPVPFRIEDSTITFAPGQTGTVKTFTLEDPDRLVIDVFQGMKKDVPDREAVKTQKEEKDRHENNLPRKSPANAGHNTAEQKVMQSSGPSEEKNNGDIIPEKYKAMWTLLESGNIYAVMKELPLYKSDDSALIGPYYFIYGEAHIQAKQNLDAIKYLRLAYIYAVDEALKERALIRRAEIHLRSGLLYEARADYILFIRDYPGSPFIERAHQGLAESLSGIGLYREALRHYEKSGTEAEALYGRANTLQKLGNAYEAEAAYKKAMFMDVTYPEGSPETYYLIGENLRMTGELEDAKRHLSKIDSGPFQDNSVISLGLIAREEGDVKESLRRFTAAASSNNQEVKIQALFNLALLHTSEGRYSEALSVLEELRHNHYDSSIYKDTLLLLSRLYKKEGKMKESVSLLKELVYGKQPPEEAFAELEKILDKAGEETTQENPLFLNLWNEVGQWLVDAGREKFLLKAVKNLRPFGEPFVELCSWLVENASRDGRGRAATYLADYYISIGSERLSRKYIDIARANGQSGDEVLRAEAKLFLAEGSRQAALEKFISIRKVKNSDLEQLAHVISNMDNPEDPGVDQAIRFFKNALSTSEWDADVYSGLADILSARSDVAGSLKYYRIAYEKDPENRWAAYRFGRAGNHREAEDTLSRLEKEDNLIGRLARSKRMEMAVLNRIREVY